MPRLQTPSEGLRLACFVWMTPGEEDSYISILNTGQRISNFFHPQA